MNDHIKTKSPKILVIWQIIIAVIITAIIAGGAVYLWQSDQSKIEKDKLEDKIRQLEAKITSLEESIEQQSKEMYQKDAEESSYLNGETSLLRGRVHYMQEELLRLSEQEPLFFYLERLKDSNFTNTYGHGYTWYIAAEELGNNVGKPAIPYLIKMLDTEDDYERTQVLYALRLTAQHKDVKVFTHGEFPTGGHNLAFPPPGAHSDLVKVWKQWWEKYKSHWE